MNYVQSYNQRLQEINNNGGFGTLIKKALDSSNAGTLVPQFLEKIISQHVQMLSPMISQIKPFFGAQKAHDFNKVTSLGSIGGAMGESATPTVTNSTVSLDSIPLKTVMQIGSVSKFLQNASEARLDALIYEIENKTALQTYSLESYLMFGNANADGYQFSGFDRFIVSNRFNDGFSSGLPTVPTNLVWLDSMIDRAVRKKQKLSDLAIVCSPEMQSLISRLVTNINLWQTNVMVEGGWRVNSYRGVKILPSTFTGGAGAGTMGAVVAASGGTTTGGLSDGSYYFRVSPIGQNGEELCSAQASVTLSGGTATQYVNLTFTAFTNAIGYKIYAGTTTGIANSTLIDWQAAKTYDGSGNITGDKTTLRVDSMTATSNVSGMTSDRPLSAVSSMNGESVYLVSLDPYQGLGKFAYNNAGAGEYGIVSIDREIARTNLTNPFIIYTMGALVPSFEASSAVSRGWRVA